MPAPNAGDVIAGYLKLRDEKAVLAEKHKEDMAPLNEKLQRLEVYMLSLLNAASVDSMAFKGVGTMFKKNVQSVTVEEWDATLGWIRGGEHWEFLERRVSKTVVQEYSEASGTIPPGVKVTNEVVVQVRKS